MNTSDDLLSELITLDVKFYNFKQLYKHNDKSRKNDNIKLDRYCQTNSFLYSATSNENIEFRDGKPVYFIVYQMIVAIGSSKNPNDYCGLANCMDDDTINFIDYNFNIDFLIHHPSKIETFQCQNKKCTTEENKNNIKNGFWCTNCNNEFRYAYNLKHFIKNTVRFVAIPAHSIIYIDKIRVDIDENDLESIKKVKKILDEDKKKIEILQFSISEIEQKVKKTIEKLQIEQDYNQKILDKMLSIRGGSIENYCNMLSDYDNKIISMMLR